ncbi:MAG: hypothetical protein EXR00_06035 [Alphaproteobacteria bacterium]|nr:hypothetical protein [Alphaproteobacteria bacterium]
MNRKTGILCGVVMASLIGVTAASAASIPSSPAERAATAELNRQIAMNNAASEARFQAQLREYEAQKRQYEAQVQASPYR